MLYIYISTESISNLHIDVSLHGHAYVGDRTCPN